MNTICNHLPDLIFGAVSIILLVVLAVFAPDSLILAGPSGR